MAMELNEILALIGFPSIFVAVLGALFNMIRKTRKDNEAIKKGIQAMLRAQMISEWNKWSEKGFAPIYARQNFENCWEQYHTLGANGVMDDIHVRFFQLPTEPQID
jgi:hypothetical protein